MAGKRQHILPQFLLKGFASRKSDDEVFAWMCRRGSSPIEANIKNIAVERFFYGDPTTDSADAAVTSVEGEYALLLDDLRRGPVGPVQDVRLPGLLTHLMVRTKSLREAFRESASFLVASLQLHFTDPKLLDALLLRRPKWLDAQLAKQFPGEWSRLSRPDRYRFRERAKPLLADRLRARWDELQGQASAGFARVLRDLAAAIKEGHNAALAKTPSPGLIAQRFQQYSWVVLQTPKSLILGDTGALVRRDDRSWGAFDGGSSLVRHVFLPFATNRLLIGGSAPIETPDIGQINEAAARCSYELIVASHHDGTVEALHGLIGEDARILEPEEVEQLVNVALHELAVGS